MTTLAELEVLDPLAEFVTHARCDCGWQYAGEYADVCVAKECHERECQQWIFVSLEDK